MCNNSKIVSLQRDGGTGPARISREESEPSSSVPGKEPSTASLEVHTNTGVGILCVPGVKICDLVLAEMSSAVPSA